MVNELSNFQRIPGSAQHYRNVLTGQEITYRQFLDVRYQERGYTSFAEYRREVSPIQAIAASAGWRNYRDSQTIRNYNMYEVFERIAMVRGAPGGIPIETLEDLNTAESKEFNRLLADVWYSGRWPGSHRHHTRARARDLAPPMNDAIIALFTYLGIAPQDWQRTYENLWMSP